MVKVFKAMEYQALYVVSGRDEFQAHKHAVQLQSPSKSSFYLTNGSHANRCPSLFTLRENPKKMTLAGDDKFFVHMSI